MKKAIDLRAHLSRHVTGLDTDPERLVVRIPKGVVACRAGSLSFEYRYEVEVAAIDFNAHIDTLIIPLLAWIAINQPDLLQGEGEAIRIEAEVIDHEKSDIAITLALSERVIVTPVDGGYQAAHCDEPALPDYAGPTPWRIFINDQPLAEATSP